MDFRRIMNIFTLIYLIYQFIQNHIFSKFNALILIKIYILFRAISIEN